MNWSVRTSGNTTPPTQAALWRVPKRVFPLHRCNCSWRAHTAHSDVPGLRDYRRSPIKRNVKGKISPSAPCRSLFGLGIQPDCLNVDSYSESGLPQAKRIALCPRVKRSINGSPLWFHVVVETAPIVSLKLNKPNRCPPDKWQHMVLSETRGLWLCSIVREGIGWIRRLACRKARA